MLPLVSFGIVNCNRLFYLKSCFESLNECTSDYQNREFIVVDNASIEEGTEEYLLNLESRGVKVIRNEKRDPANEFAKGLNTICKIAKGDFIVPLQGDMQFVLNKGWLKKYVAFAEANKSIIGCITLDAQRNLTNLSNSQKMLLLSTQSEAYKFLANQGRPPISGAGDVFYTREIIDLIYPWCVENENHEGTKDSETEMLQKVNRILNEQNIKLTCMMPVIPVSIAIYTDPRGTNARIRGNRRYGKYLPPDKNNLYYDLIDYEGAIELCKERINPVSIEEIAIPLGWEKMLDGDGNWLKNPIRPETASKDDYKEIDQLQNKQIVNDVSYIEDWLNN